jgi:carbonic anhydrase
MTWVRFSDFELKLTDNPSNILVMTALFQLTPSGIGLPFMDTIASGLANIQQSGTNTMIGEIDLSPVTQALANPSFRNFAYNGSLTQPPCTEGVAWLIPDQQFPITVAQFNALKSVLKFNSRYTQNKLGDGNLLQIAEGNDTNPGETQQQQK